MKKMLFGMLATVGLTCSAHAVSNVVISQVYGGGGNGGAPFNADFVELYNRSAAPVDITGFSVQYVSAAGPTPPAVWSKLDIPGTVVLQPGQYYLVQMSNPGANGVALPTPDATAAPQITMGSTGGKVALVGNTTALAVPCPPSSSFVDLVGYGVANCSEGSPTPATSNTTAAVRNNAGCTDTDNNSANFTIIAPTPRNTASTFGDCTACIDCDADLICDATEINNSGGVGGIGGTLDCNSNGSLDSCELTANPNLDCDANGRLDSCDVAGNPALDCNNNGIIDCVDYRNGTLTDVNANTVPDSCEGAASVETAVNATVQPAGIRGGSNGLRGFNIQGSSSAQFASYGATRFNPADFAAVFDAAYGPGQWEVTSVYFYLQQFNAAFSAPSFTDGMQLYYTNNDTQDLTVPPSGSNPNTVYDDFATDFADRALLRNFTYTRGSINGDGSGTIEPYQFYTAGGTNPPGANAVVAEIESGTGTLTLLVNTDDSFAAATYAGYTHETWSGPRLVVFAVGTGPGCDPDFNGDGNSDQDDVACIIDVVAGNPGCQTQDPDFNQDGNVDQDDVAALINVVAGGPCP